MYFYAMTDARTGDNPAEFTEGFANTKEVIAFDSKRARSHWLNTTKLLTARSLTRAEARKYSQVEAPGVKFARCYKTGKSIYL